MISSNAELDSLRLSWSVRTIKFVTGLLQGCYEIEISFLFSFMHNVINGGDIYLGSVSFSGK